MMRAQFAIEYFFIITFLLSMIVPILTYSYFSTAERINDNNARNFVKVFSTNINYIYSRGPGTTWRFRAVAPGGIDYSESFIANQTIKLVIGGKPYSRDMKAKVLADLPQRPGDFEYTLTYLDSGYIMLGNSKVLAPPRFKTDLVPLQNYIETFNVTNMHDGKIEDLRFSVEGPSFVLVNPISFLEMAPGETQEIEYRVNAPPGKGDYTGNIKIKEKDNIMRVIPFTVHVS
jgi:hypothetical protein